MPESNDNFPFAHTDKKPGDVIRSDDWNKAMNEVMRLETAKVNRQEADTIQGPLTIEKALTLNDKVGIGTAPGTERLKVQGDTAISGNLTIHNSQAVLELTAISGKHGRHAYLVSRPNPSNVYSTDLGFKVRKDRSWTSEDIPDAMTIACTGNVGIGIAPSTERLKVQGDTTVVGSLSITDNNSLSVTGTSTLTGNVSIGADPETDSNAERLKVTGNTTIVGSLSTTGTNGNLTVAGNSTLNGNTAIAGSLSIGVQDYTIEVTGSSNASPANNQTSLTIKNISSNQLANGDGINTVILKPDGSIRTGQVSHNIWLDQTSWDTWANVVSDAPNGDVVVVASRGGVKPVLQTSSKAKELLTFIGASTPSDNQFKGSVSYALVFVKGKRNSARELFKPLGQGNAVLTTSYWTLSSALDVIGNAAIAGSLSVTGPCTLASQIKMESGVIQRGGNLITSTQDLGLYSQVDGNWLRFVTNNAPIRFFTGNENGGIGSDERMAILANGNVGIGTTNPTKKLEVKGHITMTAGASNHDSYHALATVDANTLIFGGVYKTGIYFYWKSDDGKRYGLCINGKEVPSNNVNDIKSL